MSPLLSHYDDTSPGPRNKYAGLGYPENPFQPEDLGPFYTKHLEAELNQIQQWVNDVHGGQRTAFSMAGMVGAGKTRILKQFQSLLNGLPTSEKVWVSVFELNVEGYAKSSVGRLLLTMVEQIKLPEIQAPEGVLPLVWAILNAGEPIGGDRSGPIATALRIGQNLAEEDRKRQGERISQWLNGGILSATAQRQSGLLRRLDWEGMMIPTVSSLLLVAKQVGVIQTVFLFIDQLEDLFSHGFSKVRRSRLLTDLRALIDYIDAGTPIGLLLSWSPEFQMGRHGQVDIEQRFSESYQALFSRMQRQQISRLPLLDVHHAKEFAAQWVKRLKGQPGWDPKRQPSLDQLVEKAFKDLSPRQMVFHSKQTPRKVLTALRQIVEDMAAAK